MPRLYAGRRLLLLREPSGLDRVLLQRSRHAFALARFAFERAALDGLVRPLGQLFVVHALGMPARRGYNPPSSLRGA